MINKNGFIINEATTIPVRYSGELVRSAKPSKDYGGYYLIFSNIKFINDKYYPSYLIYLQNNDPTKIRVGESVDIHVGYATDCQNSISSFEEDPGIISGKYAGKGDITKSFTGMSINFKFKSNILPGIWNLEAGGFEDNGKLTRIG